MGSPHMVWEYHSRRSGGIGRRARLRAWLLETAVQVQVLSPALFLSGVYGITRRKPLCVLLNWNYATSGSLQLDCRIESLQFHAGVGGGELPIDLHHRRVSFLLPCRHLL